MGRIFALNYSLNEVEYEEIEVIFASMQSVLNADDRLIIMPHSYQLRELEVEDLVKIRDNIDIILKSKEV